MLTITENSISAKIKTFAEIAEILEKMQKQGLKVVQCHGVFDLLHPGHIRHFREAKQQGDKLIVTLTPDRFVNKGPNRPAFTESLRLESIAALSDVDYVVLNDAPDAISAIHKIRPNVYVKGMEYANHKADVTGKIGLETKAVEDVGGSIYYTDDIVFSSSNLINRHIDVIPPKVKEFIDTIKKTENEKSLIQLVDSLHDLKVLIIGDAIIDEYQYVEPMGQSGKGTHMCAKTLDKDVFLGGSLIIANHVAQFSNHVTLLTAIGQQCPFASFITKNIDPKVQMDFVKIPGTTTLIKKRYVLKDGTTLSKLFETYSGYEDSLNASQTHHIIQHIEKLGNLYDLIIVCDFGNGFTNSSIINAIGNTSTFLAINTQTNSGNRGYNVITNYPRADFISLNEPELRLAANNKTGSLDGIASDICQFMHSSAISVTRGIKGVLCLSDNETVEIPAFATTSVDRIGAGDSYLSLASLCFAKKAPIAVSGFIGSLAAAMSVQMIGNAEPINKGSLCKFITRIMK